MRHAELSDSPIREQHQQSISLRNLPASGANDHEEPPLQTVITAAAGSCAVLG
jgi:hypothetical protein